MAYSLDNSDLNLKTLDEETYAVPESRIKNASVGRNVYQALFNADKGRAFNRARHQALADGEPPFDQSVLAATGQGSRTNCDWGDTQAAMAGIEAGVIDMDVSVEKLMRTPILKSAVPDDETRFNYENIAAEEFSRTIRDWEEYDRSYLNLGRTCFGHGVGIAYFEDDRDWRFETTGLGDFVIPSGTKASENRITVAACLRYMELHEIYGCIRNEKAAKKMGWDVKAVKKAILNAAPEEQGRSGGWMKFQEDMRNNDIGCSISGKTSKVGVIHLWVQEFDGTVSKYLAALTPLENRKHRRGGDDEDSEPWLYERRNVYPEMRRGLVFFTYSIGEHGTYHSISGMLRRIFPQANAINRSLCTMLDAAIVGAGILMQPETETSISRMKLVPLGGALTLLPSKEHGEMILRPMPDVAGGLAPLLADFRNTIASRAGQLPGDSPLNQPVEKTRFQVAAELDSLGKVGSTQVNLWYPPRSRLLREQVRRICRKNYSEASPGGKEVAALKKRLEARGFPVELLQSIDFDAVTAERAIGAGSGASRIGRLEQLKEYAGELGESGRYRLMRDLVAATLGGDYDAASRYIPAAPASAPAIDTQFANLENLMVKMGQEPKLIDGQMPLVHLDVHIPFLVEMVQSTQGSDEVMIEMAEPMQILHSHCVEHLDQIQDARTIEQRVAQYRQLLQNLGGIVGNAVEMAIAQQQQAAEEQGGQNGEADAQSAAIMQKVAETQVELDAIRTAANVKEQIKADEAAQKLQHKELAFRQDAVLKDAKTHAEILVSARKAMRQQDDASKLNEMKLTAMKRGNPRKPTTK